LAIKLKIAHSNRDHTGSNNKNYLLKYFLNALYSNSIVSKSLRINQVYLQKKSFKYYKY